MGWKSTPRRAGQVSTAIVVTAALTLTAAAALYEGFPTAEVDLNDGGVWVTKQSELVGAHLNFQSQVLDGAVRAASNEFDLHQAGNNVVFHASGDGIISQVDPATFSTTGDSTVPVGAQISLSENTLSLYDPATGGLYAYSTSSLGSIVVGEEPDYELGAGAVITTTGGQILGIGGQSGQMVRFPSPDSEPEVSDFATFPTQADLKITSVGDQPVVLDSLSGTLYLPGGEAIELPDAAGGELQQPGSTHDSVFITTASTLIEQPLDGSEATITHPLAPGVATPPVWLNGCAYAVWSESGSYVRDCLGTAEDVNASIPDLNQRAELLLRQNRDVVVINDVQFGQVWLTNADLKVVDNWEDVIPPPDPLDGEEDSHEPSQSFTLPERSDDNRPPVAVDDVYGVRAGSSTVVFVTENDTDPDGDLLTVTLQGNAPAGTTIEPVIEGSAFQITVDEDVTGSLSFRYVANDGRGGEASASVRVDVRPDEVNGDPEQFDVLTLPVERGATMRLDAMQGWRDPDGDELILDDAFSEDGDRIDFRSNGVLDVTPISDELGVREVSLVVADGRGGVTTGRLRLDVREPGTLAPITSSDRVEATAGQHVTIEPLKNDISTSGQPLRLSMYETPEGTQIIPDYDRGTLDFVSSQVGTHYLQYLATDGPGSSAGLIRVDVAEPTDEALAPVAVRDVALLPHGGDVLVDVLANDSDPRGGMLVVQSVRNDNPSAVNVEILEHRILRITDLQALNEAVTVSYNVSNGVETSTGEVRVLPVRLPDQLRAPVTQNDTAVVRVGDVVSVNVLENDYHPDGDALTLVPELVEPLPTEDVGQVFTSGNQIRFKAGDTPGTAYVTYEVEDSQFNRTAGYLTIQILPFGDANSAPQPRPVEGRVVAGNEARIPIPLDGIDTDGDSVELLGLSSAPSLGRVTTGDTWITYEAYPDSAGTDSFTYRVKDRQGAVAEASIVVGVGQASMDNQPPNAVRDYVTVRPERQVAVPVLVNDSDPDGDRIGLSPNLTISEGITAEVDEDRILVTAPAEPGDYTINYTVADVYGATDDGVLVVTVDPEAPLLAPVVRDDRVQPEDITATGAVTVDVLANDEDPDGVIADGEITLDTTNARVGADGQVTVNLSPESQIVRYTVTDLDGLDGSAFIFVPGLDEILPKLIMDEAFEVVSGELLEIDLEEITFVRPGRTPQVSVADTARTSHGNGDPLVIDATTLHYTSQDGYHGPDALSVEVTDGTGPDDPEGNSAYLAIPITVLPKEGETEEENNPPTLRNATLEVAPGEEPATLNLALLAEDPDPADAGNLQFSLEGSVPGAIDMNLNGTTVSASAPQNAQKGSVFEVPFSVTDGKSDPVTATLTVTITASNRPLPVANEDVVPEAHAGQSVSVSVLANDFNPFPDTPLRVITSSVISGQGSVTNDSSDLTVTPATDYFGTMVVSYRIADATDDPDRYVDGRVTLTVQARPDAPSRPMVTSVQDRTVVLSWTPPPNNGSPITGYTVSSPQGYSKACPATTCTLDGLTNDVEYTFTVTATNAVGESDPSPVSEVARPDARPDTPAPPSLRFGDKSLDISWVTPHSDGSPVSSFNLEISPAPPSGQVQMTGVTGNSLTWSGLENGVAYQVRVQAVNRAPEPSSWSQYSISEIPAGVPDAPGRPTTTPTQTGSTAQISVNWTAPFANGDAVSEYTVTAHGGNGSNQSQQVSGTSATFNLAISEQDYTFSVVARNKAGTSEPSAASAPRRAANAPGAPSSVTLTPHDRRVDIRFQPGALNGNRAGEITYHYRLNSGQTGTMGTGGTTVSGLSNGTSYTATVWATSTVDGVASGGQSTSGAVVPYGAPIISNFQSHRRDNAVHFTWNVNSNGRPITGASHGGVGDGNRSHTQTGVSPGASYTLNLRVTNAGGTTTASASGRANDPPPPPQPRAWVTRSGNTTTCQIGGGTCHYLVINYQNFPDGGTKYVRCYGDGSEIGTRTQVSGWLANTDSSVTLGKHYGVGNSGRMMHCTIENVGGSLFTTESRPW